MKTAFLLRLTDRPLSGKDRTLFWFINHLIIYSVIMAATTAVNMTVEPSRPWILLILFGWCGLLIIHAQNVMKSSVEHND